MQKKINVSNILRIIDANANRAREGLRVCEDICRFFLNTKAETRRLKELRHRLTQSVISLGLKEIINARDVENDQGRGSTTPERSRKDVKDIFFANIQRVKESVRVLEECSKLFKISTAEELKKIRYEIYKCEKKVAALL